MSKILVLNGHHPYSFSEGRLNAALAERARAWLEAQGHEVRVAETAAGYHVEEQVENHQWADTVILQFPVNWMGVPWSFKKYMDEVYSAAMDGRLCTGDGRTSKAPKDGYGTGGTASTKTYMLSLTFNAPREAFDDPAQYLFEGRSIDDLMMPYHMNFRFFGMSALPTFSAHDVMKAPEIEADFARFDAHLDAHFG